MGNARKWNEILRHERESRNWTQAQIAQALRIETKRVSEWEIGKTKPSYKYRAKLQKLFKMSAEEFGFIVEQESSDSSQTSILQSQSPLPPEGDMASRIRAPSTFLDDGVYTGISSPEDTLPSLYEKGETLAVPIVWIPAHQVVDVLRNTSNATPEQKLGAALALEAHELTTFFDEGWSIEELLEALRVVLHGAKGMSKITRRTFGRTLLKLGTAAMLSGISIPDGRHVSAEELTELHSALSACIQAGWKLFVTASMPQILVVGQAQLHLLHQCHAELYPSMRPLFYSPVYRLVGAALFFQARYAEAMQAHTQAYLTALEACDPWNMAESLGWQAGVLKACGKQAESIQTTEAALRLLGDCHDSPMLASRARFLAHWAESAALLGERTIMEEKLSSSAELLAQFEGNDEFDAAIWQLYRGTCALYIGDSASADTYLEQALHDLKPNLLHQRASAVLLQAQARLKMGNMKGSLEVVRTAVPLVVAADSPLLDRGLIDQIEQLTTTFPRNTEVKGIVTEVQRYPRLCAFHAQQQIPRYLEAKL
jgi:transcriptional regulator with XRE-family HTH domain